ncbi:MAG: sigma-54-dependent Fis family transcriptional regulator [Fibrobacteres bacterium]|nr:sigma-54-dependent Fis family transcriptional regulator [Fibrobacterota bacterium]
MKKIRILIVDDETEIRNSLTEVLSEEGYATGSAADASSALNDLGRTAYDLVLLDIKLGSDDGMALLKQLKEEKPTLPVIMITGHGTVSLAAEAFRIGAHDFLEKPLRLLQVRTAVRNALEKSFLRKSLVGFGLGKGVSAPVIVSPKMKELYSKSEKLSSIKTAVLITGASGTGKDLLARSLHYSGNRASAPFVVTNAASLPVNLAKDELFGHERGAFTGAHAQRAGRIEEADGGTLFLDEIADMDLAVQAKILRVIETGECVRLGGGKPSIVDVRFVCATHKDLPTLIKEGKFREDLFYRLSGFVLSVPTLKERKEDIIPLAIRFMQQFAEESGRETILSKEAEELLLSLQYKGNVRELKHIIHRAAVFCSDGIIKDSDIEAASEGDRVSGTTISENLTPNFELSDFSTARHNFEVSFLQKAMELCGNNITLTAQKIGMAQSNLSRKLKDLGLRV